MEAIVSSIPKFLPSTFYAKTLADLAAIYESHLNVVVHRRTVDQAVAEFVRGELLTHDQEHRLRLDNANRDVADTFPWPAPEAAVFHDEIAFLTEIYSELFGARTVGVRIVCARAAMCPRFHVDKVGVRMVCTYEGPGTEWLDNACVRRERLGHASKGLSDERSGLVQGSIHRMNSFDIGLLKGEGWPGNDGHGSVHRSPAHDDRRVFISLEAI